MTQLIEFAIILGLFFIGTSETGHRIGRWCADHIFDRNGK